MRNPLARLSRDRLVTAVTLLALLAMAARVSVDSDTWWHLRAGAWMIEKRQVLAYDVFTSTMAGRAWEYPAWLSQVLLAGLFARWGFGALNLFTALCVALAFALVYLTCPGSVYVRSAATLLGAVTSAVFWSARPQIISLALAAAVLFVLSEFRRRPGPRRLWLLPPLMVLWANVHPGFALGFILIGLTGIGEAGKAMLGRGSWRTVAWLATAAGLCTAALLLTPYGPRLLLFPFKTLSSDLLRDRIQEWQAPNFHIREAQVFIVLWLATFAAIGLGRVRLDLTDLCLLAGTLWMALLAGRNIAVFALVAPPILARHLQSGLDGLRVRLPAAAAVLTRQPDASFRIGPALNWLLLLTVTVGAAAKVGYVLDPVLNQRLALRAVPARAAEYLASERPVGTLFNPYQWGGYLAWRLYPTYAVYVDGRTDLYDEAFLREYLRLAAGAPEWETDLARHGVRLLLVEAGSPLAGLAAADEDWTEVYGDDVAAIFERR